MNKKIKRIEDQAELHQDPFYCIFYIDGKKLDLFHIEFKLGETRVGNIKKYKEELEAKGHHIQVYFPVTLL